MLSPDYLEHVTDRFLKEHVEKAIEAIIKDAARRIAKTGTITETAEWQMMKLAQLGAYHDYVLAELAKAIRKSQADLLELFDEVAQNALASDDEIYRAVGYDPVPLKDNAFMQGLIWSAYERTNGTLDNLTRTTANTASRQFERILDEAHMRLVSGAFSIQEVVRWGVKELAGKGIAAINYSTGHVDYADTAFRRATLTGLNQAGLALQERRSEEMGCEYVEVTAHAGARPSHAVWQGKVYKLHGSEPDYPNFYEATGYGTGAGLGGWNCRHGFYPFSPGLSEHANTKAYLDELNNATVTYNGKEMSLYDATQLQRRMERQIRRYKREYLGMKEVGQDTTEAAVKLRTWREREKDFLRQTGLLQQRDREQVVGFGRSEAGKATAEYKAIAKVANSMYDIGSEVENVKAYMRDKPIRDDIRSGKYPLTVNVGQQNKHIIGTHEYQQYVEKLKKKGQFGPSRVELSFDEIESLVKTYGGTGILKRNKSTGKWTNIELITTQPMKVGTVVDNITGIERETTTFKIHYGKNGIHIVPDYPSRAGAKGKE